ncbi:MAG: asparagine synthase-related protein [Candidatus Thiodiazotropha sp. 4PDIVS1]
MRNGLNNESIASLLKYHVIPYPYTVYESRYEDDPYTINDEFNYDLLKSNGTSVADIGLLKELLVSAVESSITRNSDIVLMLSSGKDSMAILYALAELGISNVYARTFSTTESEDESVVAKKFCKKLGIKHENIKFDVHNKGFSNLLLKYFESSDEPILDQAFVPYLYMLQDVSNAEILDGMGNDIYFGHVPPKKEMKAYKFISYFSKSLRGPLFSGMKPWNNLSILSGERMSPCLEGRITTRNVKSTLKLNYKQIDLANMWLKESEYQTSDYFNYRAYVRGRLLDKRTYIGKAIVAAKLTNNRIYFPWENMALSSYCFNLKENHKFDRKKHINKLLLRTMLSESIGYDSYSIGKRAFGFDKKQFIEKHMANIQKVFSSSENIINSKYLKKISTCASNDYCASEIINHYLLLGWMNQYR